MENRLLDLRPDKSNQNKEIPSWEKYSETCAHNYQEMLTSKAIEEILEFSVSQNINKPCGSFGEYLKTILESL